MLLWLALLQHAVPPGHTIERVAEARFPMFAAFDDRGRLFVAESSGLDLYAELQALTRKCRVQLLEDRDGDGRFERTPTFAESLVFPMGLAWREGKLYVADPPHLITLEDTDGDGRADRRTKILGDFGHTDNGSLHGLTFGPDGLLYMTMGMPDGYKLPSVEGGSGALIRCRPDGSAPEVVCRGFDNLVEVVFTARGDRIGTDNWFVTPQGGVRDALVDLADGGLYPRTPDSGTPQPVTGEPLTAVALFPAVALSGLAILGDTGELLSAQHNARKVQRHVLTPDGSTFRAEHFDFVTSTDPDFHPSDVLEAPDGSVLVVDTGGWYVQHCPTGRIQASNAPGGIFRVRRPGPRRAAPPARSPDAAMLSEEPDGAVRAARLGSFGAAALRPLLRSENAAVRRAGADALARAGDASALPALWTALERDGMDRFEHHAILHAIRRLAKAADLDAALTAPHPRRRAGALILHPKPDAARTAAFLSDAETRDAAFFVLKRHPEWGETAAKWLNESEPEQFRQLVLAFQTSAPVQKALAGRKPSRLLLETMAATTLEKLPKSWGRALEAALDNPELTTAAVETIAALQPAGPLLERVAALAEERAAPDAVRLAALRVAVRRRPELSPSALAFLARQDDPIARFAATEILARSSNGKPPEPPPRDDAEQRALLSKLEPLLTGGDPARGRTVFFGRTVACAGCHRVGAEGGTVGPDLTKIGAVRAGRDLVEAIVAPSSTFAQGYTPYRVDLTDGSVLRGVIARQTDQTLVMRDAAGAETRIPRGEIADLKPSPAPVMPEGLDRGLTPEQMRDLLAYLQSLR